MKPQHFALAVVVSAIGGFQFVVIKVGLGEFPPVLFAAARFVLVIAVLSPYLKRVPGRMVEIAVIALFFGVLHYPLMFLGIKLSAGISSVAIAVQLYAPFSVLIAALFLRERVGRRRLLGLALAFGGVVVIGFEPSVYERLAAFLCVVGGALSMGLAIVLIARTQGIPILTLQAWMALMAVGPLLLLSLAFEGNPTEALAGAGWLSWAMVAYTAIVGTIISHGGWYYLQRIYPVSVVSTLLLMAPVFGVALGMLIYGEVLTWRFLLGAAATLAGVVAIANAGARRPAAAAAALPTRPPARL